MGQFISIKSKKGQGWSLDVVVAGVIFLAGIIILYFYAINYTSQTQKNLEDLFYEGNVATEFVLSNGDFGILSNNKINQTKLDEFNNSYAARKQFVGVTRDFYFVFDGMKINGVAANYAGKMNSTNTESLIQITRVTIYENKPVKFQLYVWEQE